MAIEFHPMAVTVRPQTDESVSLTFDVPETLRPTFTHLPGQHLVLRAVIDGEEVRRSYSICTAPGGNRVTVGVKRIPGGLFSTWATTQLADGDTVEVMAPIGEFHHRPAAGAAAHYVFLAAGSGITPVLSMLSAILELEEHSRCTLVYGNRTVGSIMFLEELEGLKDRFCDRFQLIHTLSREGRGVPLFEGRIDVVLVGVHEVDKGILFEHGLDPCESVVGELVAVVAEEELLGNAAAHQDRHHDDDRM
mgnify:CR=1 FL=1